MAGNKDHVLDLKRPRKGVLDLINDPEPERHPEAAPPPGQDDLSPLPGLNDSYRAYSRASNKTIPTLVFILSDGSMKGLPYSLLDSAFMTYDGQGPRIVLQFSGLVPQEVTLAGRNLETLFNYICFNRISWVRELGTVRDFETHDGAVVGSISISNHSGESS